MIARRFISGSIVGAALIACGGTTASVGPDRNGNAAAPGDDGASGASGSTTPQGDDFHPFHGCWLWWNCPPPPQPPHPPSPDAGATSPPPPSGCTINGNHYSDQDVNPSNICQWCDSSKSATSWSSITDGAACGTDEACFGGVCTSHFPDCVIDGTAYPPDTANPQNACALCQPRQSETSWTNAPDGSPCPGGSCFAGACD